MNGILEKYRTVADSCVVVAEIGNNHQGDFDLARRCIEAAAAAGADMVKMQKRHMPTLLTRAVMDRPYSGPNSFGSTYGAHRMRLELAYSDMAALKAYAESLGLTWFASVWDEQSLEDMLQLGVEYLKLPSADLVNEDLLRRTAATGLPLILSTGMSTLEQIDRAIEVVSGGTSPIILLHCNSSYPCPPEDIALPVMQLLRERYGLPVGYSGHEKDMGPSVAAVALGACMVERHFTLDRTMPGTDHACSLTPDMFAQMTRMIRDVEAAMRVTQKRITPAEQAASAKLRKQLVLVRDLPAGHRLQADDMRFMCTGQGSDETSAEKFVGAVLRCAVAAETPVSAELVCAADQAQEPVRSSRS